MAGIRTGRSGPTSVPAPRDRPQMVLGSRPQSMYAPRIKPAPASQRQYGKQPAAGSNPAGTGFSSLLGGED